MRFIKDLWYYFLNIIKKTPHGGIKYSNLKFLNSTKSRKHFCFTCIQCGKCCEGSGRVYFTKSDLLHIKQYLRLSNSEYSQLLKKLNLFEQNGLWVYRIHSRCIFLDENQLCKIYPVRPLQCRTFPYWSYYFRSEKNFRKLLEHCPGAQVCNNKKSPLIVSIPEIVFRCNQTSEKFYRQQTLKDSKDIITL
ncbi:MAG: YkgJ family cysteine cluster protein [Leptospiraceae bacterium]|nr:YkgJ family cysteine cluster protein [Leptospiraceae bacterium]MDW7975646.1 YkgJ family cysteine cluster protein [Leptospiraceae bacterium]